MNQRFIVSSALASALTMGLAGPAAAQAKEQEKCFGIVKAGQNDCASLSGSHSCSGQAKSDGAPDEWKYVPQGTCKALQGQTEAEAKLALQKK